MVPLDDVPRLMQAYELANKGENANVSRTLKALEDYALKHFLSLTPNQAAQIIICHGANIQSAELIEICEKTIAADIDQIAELHGGFSVILDTLHGFLGAKCARQKVVEVLCSRLTKDISRLNLTEKCEFLRTLTLVEDEAATMQASGQVDFTTTIDYYLETIEPYIMDQLNVMTLNDVLNAIVGFSHPQSTRRYDVLDALESRLVSACGTNQMGLEEAAHVLYELSRLQIGSKIAVDSLTTKIDAEVRARFDVYKAKNYRMTKSLQDA